MHFDCDYDFDNNNDIYSVLLVKLSITGKYPRRLRYRAYDTGYVRNKYERVNILLKRP